MSDVEGLGEAVSGGMIARTVEPRAGERTGAAGELCLNCGTALVGPWCHGCGQQGHVHRTLTAFFHDLLHGALHFEGKIWRTLPLLAWRPGELTRRYVEGERARFVSPIAIFLFSVFLMFAVFSTVGGPFNLTGSVGATEARSEIEREKQDVRQKIVETEAARRERASEGRPTAELDSRLSDLRQELSSLEAAKGLLGSEEKEAAPARGAEAQPGGVPGEEGMSDGAVIAGTPSGIKASTGWEAFDQAIEKASRNPSLLAYKLQASAYKFSWALIPISVPFVWLLFLWRRQFRAYDHTVFVTYSLAAMTLLVVILSLIRPFVPSSVAAIALTFIPPWHMYRQLKGGYGLSRFSALWRTFLLLIFAAFAATFFFILLLIVGLLG